MPGFWQCAALHPNICELLAIALRHFLVFRVHLKLKGDFQRATLMLFILLLVNMTTLLIWKDEQSACILQLLMWGGAQGRAPGWSAKRDCAASAQKANNFSWWQLGCCTKMLWMPAALNKGLCPTDRSKKAGASLQNGECYKYDLKVLPQKG